MTFDVANRMFTCGTYGAAVAMSRMNPPRRDAPSPRSSVRHTVRAPVLDCCATRTLDLVRTLASTYWRDLALHRCRACSTHWLVEHEKIAMNAHFEDVAFDRYAPITADEAASLEPSAVHLAFLADRPVPRSVRSGVLA